jgi:hypothetical protein
MCSCDLGKSGVGRIHYGSPHEGQVRGSSTHQGSRTQREEGRPRSRRLPFCPMSEPEVIENASATKQDTSGEAFVQSVFFY